MYPYFTDKQESKIINHWWFIFPRPVEELAQWWVKFWWHTKHHRN